ncbi:MAG: type II toxin-antitoxin system PemK/MazF family toxin [Symbiobacteriaceae bacterium]|nr:type II toxin-antitoxin system PemK/MazF family toxin [Symbiobacteriaceae bacterium]
MANQAQQGDIVWINMDPQAGHEQSGRRPAVVISNNVYNDFSHGLAMVCPITGTDRGSPLQIKIEKIGKISGFIMCDQARVLDIIARNAEFEEQLPEDLLHEVVDVVIGMIEIISR